MIVTFKIPFVLSHVSVDVSLDGQCLSVQKNDSRHSFPVSLDKGLREVRAVDFDVDLNVIVLLLFLFVERVSVVQQVERQQEAQHAEDEESNVHPEWVSPQRAHHSQKQGLLQESKHSADQRLHSCETAKLGGRIHSCIKTTNSRVDESSDHSV